MKIKLKKLTIKDFKGIEDLELEFDEKTVIRGKNASGKTTIFDAYTWLLWDKDSSGKSKFTIQPYGKEEVTPTVIADLDIDGESLELKKEFKKGQREYYYNSEPVKKKDYDKRLEKIIEEKDFMMLSDIAYFSTVMDTKEKRAELYSLIGEIKKEDLEKEEPALKDLDIEGKDPMALQKIAEKEAREIKKEREDVPVVIKSIKELLTEGDLEEYKEKAKKIKETLEEERERNIGSKDLEEELQRISKRISELDTLDMTKANYEKDLENKKRKIEEARKKWEEINGIEYNSTCPVCGQEYPEDKKEEVIKNQKIKKAKDLEAATKEGMELKEDIERLEKSIREMPGTEKERKEISERIEILTKETEKGEEEVSIQKLEEELEEINKKIAGLEQNKQVEEKIKNLEDKEKDLAIKLEEAEKTAYLTGLYSRTKAKLVSDKINEQFKTTKFDLFEEMKNGNIKDIAEPTDEGVLYQDTNTAKKINIGLEIINVLGKHKDIRVPVFVDNYESVNKLIDTDSQLILLEVEPEEREKDSKLLTL